MSNMSAVLSNYRAQLPLEIPLTMAKSGAISFAIATLCSGSLVTGVVIGTLAAISTLINNLSKPIFRRIWGNPPSEEWWQRIVRQIVVISITSLAIAPLLAVKIPIIEAVVITAIADFIFTRFQNIGWIQSDTTLMTSFLAR